MQTDDDVKSALLDAILPHVAFDGWSETAFRAALSVTGADPARARALCPRGAVDLAVAFHQAGDRAMAERLQAIDLNALRFRDRIARAVMTRIEAVEDKEVVRRGSALFALPLHSLEGARLIWGTADAIWIALGDPSRDINWYTKRVSLSGVYGATLLYWLGDDSPDHQATREFLDRRVGDVMRIERAKADFRDNRVLSKLFAGPIAALDRVRAPGVRPQGDLPGYWPPGGKSGADAG